MGFIALFRVSEKVRVAVGAAAWSPLLLAAFTDVSAAQAICPAAAPGPSAYIDSAASDVIVLRAVGGQVAAARDLLLCPGDEIVTGATGRVAIRFDEKRTVVRLDGNSRTRILTGGAAGGDVSLLSGVLYFLSSVRTRFAVDTPYIVAGIDGTEALVGVRPAEALAIAAVREGLVDASDKVGGGGTVQVAEGEAAFRSAAVPFQKGPIADLPPPFRDLLIVSRASVDWAVYYPPILFAEQSGDPRIRRAVELLSSGEYDRAAAELDAASAAEPAVSASLRTIIAIGRDRLDEAASFAEQALAADPQSPQAQIAASYSRQAAGDLAGALDYALEAERLAPDDAYVLARLAELQLTIGDRRDALATAERSLTIRRTPLALFVAGLSRLAAARYESAEALFEEAIALDPEAPLARLGRGLAYIRRGDTSAGAWEIERAVAHDPRRASLRNWLGRAYFDEGFPDKAAEQFRLSKAADPQDPTPYLYSALERYAANSPIEAARELDAAEARSRARNVLRSERGLGEDAATVGAALGRIYDVLGFEQLAIVEGAAAVDADPSNPGAHRFLAEAYRARPGNEIAQTSELLRSQLLSPPSKTPVQPQLAEADLALLDTTGPSRVSFAEFAPLFDADGLRIDASGLAGTQKTWGDEIAVTGLYRNASVSVGQFHYETDGFRENNDLTHDIFNAVATFALTPEFSLFGEYRYRETTAGERRINFDIDDFDPTLRATFNREVARAGFHAQASANSDLIGVYSYAGLFARDEAEAIPGLFDSSEREDSSHNGQLQHIWQGPGFRNVAGASYTTNSVEDSFIILGGLASGSIEYSTEAFSAYDYVYADIAPGTVLTIGGSLASFSTSTDEADLAFDVFELLPKVGLSSELTDMVTVRAAYFRSLKPELVSEQTLEPTTVAGFAQFSDAFNTSLLEQFGIGVDVKAASWLLLGAEAISRSWRVPVLDGAQPETDETLYRAYAYATLADNFALAAEVFDERSASDAVFNDFAYWRTTRIPLTLSYFIESGLFGTLGAEYVDHEFEEFDVSNEDVFTLFNASLGYRLPDQRGLFSVEVENILDDKFNYQNRTRRRDIAARPQFAPERAIWARGVLRF